MRLRHGNGQHPVLEATGARDPSVSHSLPSTHSTVQAALIEEDVREARSNDASDALIIQSPRPHRSQVPAASDLWSPRAQENGRNTHARVMSHILGCHSYECELATSMAR